MQVDLLNGFFVCDQCWSLGRWWVSCDGPCGCELCDGCRFVHGVCFFGGLL